MQGVAEKHFEPYIFPNDVPKGKKLLLLGAGISPKFKEFAVISKNGIKGDMASIVEQSPEALRTIHDSVRHRLFAYSKEELTRHSHNESKEWLDWCADVHIFYCVRYALYDELPLAVVA